MSKVGENIRARREALGMSQTYVGEQVGITGAMMSFIESGKKLPSLRTTADIARLLNCTVDDLLAEQPSA